MATADPTADRSRHHFAQMVGLSRAKNLALAYGIVVTASFGVVAGGIAWYEAHFAAGQVQRFVVYLDDQGAVVGKPIAVTADWSPEAGTYIDFARRWVRYLRSRPTDEATLIFQRKEVILSTDKRLWPQLQDAMKAADDQLRKAAVDIDSISANLVSQDQDSHSAVVLVRWVERIRQAGADTVIWTATVKVAYQPPKLKMEFERNPVGLYATSFQLTREQ